MKLLGPPTGHEFILMRVMMPRWYWVEFSQDGTKKENVGPETEQEIIVHIKRKTTMKQTPKEQNEHTR